MTNRIRDLADANAVLSQYVAKKPRFARADFKLEQVRQLMALLGDPQDQLRIVHIAGTSGKTSTAYYVAALLQAAGQKVGLTVSPHVDSVTERAQIDGAPLPEQVFCHELAIFLEQVQGTGLRPSYFVLLYAFAMWTFVRQKVDYAVVETGMGGLYDATNVTRRPDKVCVITDIGFDHMEVLGNSLPEIAAQKAGIIHRGNHVFMYEQAAAVMQVIHKRVAEQQAELHVLDKAEAGVKDVAAYQQRNWSLAREAFMYVQKRDHLPNLTRQVLMQTQRLRVPGRMDTLHTHGKTVIMDGAHNAQKMVAFIDSFRQLYPDEHPAVLIGIKDNKDYEDLVPLLVPFAARAITTSFHTAQDSQAHSMDPVVLAQALRAGGLREVAAIPDKRQAVRALLTSPEPLGVITGSFYLLSQIRNNGYLA